MSELTIDRSRSEPTPQPHLPGLGLAEVPRVLADLAGPRPGPLLLTVGGLHGNEPEGVLGARIVRAALEADPTGLRGRWLALSGNRAALALGQRFVAEDLNRMWAPERVAALRASTGELADEERELVELEREIDRALHEAGERPKFFLDVHSTSSEGPAFAAMDDTLKNRAFGRAFPLPKVLGFEEELWGTLANFLAARPIAAIGLEAGQSGAEASAQNAAAAIWLGLEAAGVLSAGARPEVAAARARLAAEAEGLPAVFEVRYRHAITPADQFEMELGWRSFRRVRRGQVVAWDVRGEVRAPTRGLLLMPLYQGQGSDGFFIARRVRLLWLHLSALMRRLGTERWLHWLPGVDHDRELAGAFMVDMRRARWLVTQVFHLLGYKRIERGGGWVRMVRRSE